MTRLPDRGGRQDVYHGAAKIPMTARLHATWGVCNHLLRCIWSGDRSWAYITTHRTVNGQTKATSVVLSMKPADLMGMTEQMNNHCRDQRALQLEQTEKRP